MFRFKAIIVLVLVAAMVLTACGAPVTEAPFAAEEFISTEPPVEGEAPAATEPLVTEEIDSNSVPTFAPETGNENEAESSSSTGTSATVVEITSDNRAEELEQYLPVLLYFWAPSNEASVAMQPVFEEIANEYAGRVKVASVNLDEYPDMGYEYSIFADGPLPTVIFTIYAREEPWLEGVTSKDEITNMLDQQLANHPNIFESATLSASGAFDTVIEIAYDNWGEIDQSLLPVLLYFWAPSDGYSGELMPFLDEIANEYAGRVKVLAVNMDDYPDIGYTYGVTQSSTLILTVYGDQAPWLEGVTSKDEITVMLDQYLP